MADAATQQQNMGLAAMLMMKEHKHHKTVMVVGGILLVAVAFTAGAGTVYAYNKYKINEQRKRALAIAANRRQQQVRNQDQNV
ncbi:MAG: hypothetical protein PHN45_00255 [Methylococcales bacterium]|nr:hypothetical protein [Methylococcales bacterium]